MMETLTAALTGATPYLTPLLAAGAIALALGVLALILHYLMATPVALARWPGLFAAAIGLLFLAAHGIAKFGNLPAALKLAEAANGQALTVPYLQIAISLFLPGYLLKKFAGLGRKK